MKKSKARALLQQAFLLGFGLLMIYPLVWMFMSSFKESSTIFQTAGSLWPEVWVWENYANGWRGVSNTTFGTFFTNSAIIATMATMGTVISSSLVGYAFSRGNFPAKKILFMCMLVTLMLPAQVLMIPQFLWFNQLGWVGTFLPLIIPAFFAVHGFFIYLIKNFVDGIPRELDEAARIDGCTFYGIYFRIMLPLMVPALITAGIFSFIWRWDDFIGPLLYLNRIDQFPASLALRTFADPAAGTDWGAVFAMSTLSLLPAVAIFVFLQKYLVEGISTSGLK